MGAAQAAVAGAASQAQQASLAAMQQLLAQLNAATQANTAAQAAAAQANAAAQATVQAAQAAARATATAAARSPTPTPTRTLTPTPTLPPGASCIPSGTACSANLAPPSGPTATGTVQFGPCAAPRVENCLDLVSTGVGFQLDGVITGSRPEGAVLDIPVVDAAGTPQGTRPVKCLPAGTGTSRCTATIAGVFPRLGATVTATR